MCKNLSANGDDLTGNEHNSRGIVFIYYLGKRETLNGTHYAVLDKVKVAITVEKPPMAREKVVFNDDNAVLHSNRIVRGKLDESRFQIMPQQLSYPPHSVLSNFHLFPKLKLVLPGRKSKTHEEVIADVK